MLEGNALGLRIEKRASPERAEQFPPQRIVSPLQGSVALGRWTQGVALGWLVAGPLALKSGVRSNISDVRINIPESFPDCR